MKVNEVITNQIISNLEKSGKWVKNWQDLGNINIKTKKAYKGTNRLILAMTKAIRKYNSNIWLTYKQARELGGVIKYEELKNYTPIVFYTNNAKKKDDEEKETSYRFIRYTKAYNLDQTTIKDFKIELQGKDNEELEQPENIARSYLTREGIGLKVGVESQAYYSPSRDIINMPGLKTFDNSDNYYHTLFHEMTHSTGHEKRLKRLDTMSHNRQEYSKEELVAELGACFLAGYSKINPNIENSSAYIKSWIKVLKNDPQMIISASSKAQKAYDYILGEN